MRGGSVEVARVQDVDGLHYPARDLLRWENVKRSVWVSLGLRLVLRNLM